MGLVPTGIALADGPPASWTASHKPFHIVGPIDYVGTRGIAVYLIHTKAGLILLDSGPAEAVPVVERNIAALGYRLRDVKIVLTTHAHWDHVAGLAAIKRDTGARLFASPGDRGALESGRPPSEYLDGETSTFAPVRVDATLTDGKPVRLGGVEMMPVITPGHTPGCTSWTMQVRENGRPLSVIFPCSLTVAGNKLIGNQGYPAIVRDFRASFARLGKLKANVVLPARPEFADVLGRAQRRDAGDPQAFIASQVLPQLVASSKVAFAQELKKQEQP
jgi:metallo-beta-lactamase class B